MKSIKFLLINIIVFGTIFTLISLLFPSVIHHSKTININGNPSLILKKIKDVKLWKRWNNFVYVDSFPQLIIQNDSQSNTISWTISNYQKLSCELSVFKSNSSIVPVSFSITQKLKWYPWQKFKALVNDKTLNEALEASLDNLKKEIEDTNINKGN